MGMKTYTIGELSGLSGLSVRRIRFYSDAGLLPPAARTDANYRIYTDLDAARLDLIRALRDAGVDLKAIGKLLARRLSMAEVLAARLEMLEAEIAAKRRTAAVLRATLRSPEPTDVELRRLWTMTALSNTQMKSRVEQFVETIAGGARIDDPWRAQMVEASTPALPDEPSAAQIEAWNELAAMLADADFAAEMKAEIAKTWDADFDPAAYREAAEVVQARVRAALEVGTDPTSPEGRSIARDWLERSARAMRRQPDGAFLAWHLAQYQKHQGHSARYQALMAVLRGEAPRDERRLDEWSWMNQALAALDSRAPTS